MPVVYVQVEAPEEEPDDEEKEDDVAGSMFSFGGKAGAEEVEDEVEEEATPWVARRTSVELGLVDDEFAEIVSGVTVGDPVVTVGHAHLRDGAQIRVVETAPDATAAASEEETTEDNG